MITYFDGVEVGAVRGEVEGVKALSLEPVRGHVAVVSAYRKRNWSARIYIFEVSWKEERQ